MKRILLSLFLLFIACSSNPKSHSRFKIKEKPDYVGVDERVQYLLDGYKSLSAENNIHFTHEVTIGFKKINEGDVVGLCTYGKHFREIDLDLEFWERADKVARFALVFHELTHCYCTRSHDFADGREYPKYMIEEIMTVVLSRVRAGQRAGFYEDECPTSLMYPYIVQDYCVRNHYPDYIKEIFERCDPF
jgi:hypothetical protein